MLKETKIEEEIKPELEDPILIEGLPGVGLVGKLVADHLINELEAEKFGEIYSPHLPHQAVVKEDGVLSLVKDELYYKKMEEGSDLIILTGDSQVPPNDGPGHYELASELLEYVKNLGVETIYTLGGYQIKDTKDNPEVLAAATSRELLEGYEDEVKIRSDEGGGIVGASGLLLGIGKMVDVEGYCLLGESPGFLVDAKAAEIILETLMMMTDIDVDTSELEERAEETEKLVKRLKKSKSEMAEAGKMEEEGQTYIR